MNIRSSSHAGSWYSNDRKLLDSQLSEWLAAAQESLKPAKAIIAPHAGYRYSGPCAAYAYKQIDPQSTRRIFILGPSHHVDIGKYCAIPEVSIYQTPLADLEVDHSICDEFAKTGRFVKFSKAQDEAEHSIEMQLPYIAKVMQGNPFTIVPLVVGTLTPEIEAAYGEILAPYLADPETVFVISSDFCHWGRRFRFQYYDQADGEIWQSIEKLDLQGMNAIESLNPEEFTSYLRKYGNTICGRRGINVLLNTIQKMNRDRSKSGHELRFLKYAQSSQCRSLDDSSVSYAAASLVIRH
ncbi:Protein memo1 [Clonorchis sinensis]|uniref:Protein memo1 n=1 Tax=Clonorchis sinensis TaxID=79923 RepID=A0A8T1MCY8_CLOSI|nr:Protein memo1 [Clonorchis sinensis]